MRIIKITAITLFTLALLIVGYAYFSTRNPKTGTLTLTGLHGNVTIVRDQYGVPHISAEKSDDDAFFALGYVHAQDRLWQIEFQRRVVAGRLSEILGKNALEKDKFLRTFGFYRAAQASWPALNTQTKSMLHSYAQGINAFLSTGRLPLQFKILRYHPEPWTDIDSFCWEKMMAYDLQATWRDKIKNYEIAKKLGPQAIPILEPAYPNNAPTILSLQDLQQSGLLSPSSMGLILRKRTPSLSPFDGWKIGGAFSVSHLKSIVDKISASIGFVHLPGKGSNNWVVSGAQTASGKPLLADDPHLALASPALWYLAELKGPHLHVIGATLAGVPNIIIGHNDYIAWGVTNVNPDAQDLYIEPANAKLTTIHEIIKVKGQPDVDLPVRISAHGPIISDIANTHADHVGPRIALKWPALMPNDTTAQSVLKINYARNWTEFVDGLRDFVTPSQNFIYADRVGNIGFYVPGHIPLRRGWEGTFPILPAQHYEWNGFIPFNALPHVFNPSEGRIITANNKVVPDEYPYSLTFRWPEPPYRVERIHDLLNKTPRHTIESFAEIQKDTVSYLWRDLYALLLKTQPLDKDSQHALETLKTWDGTTDLNSKAATIFNYWFRELTRMPVDKLPNEKYWREPLFIKQQLQSNGPYCHAANMTSCSQFLSHSLSTAIQTLMADHGKYSSSWAWGKIHRMHFNELALGQVHWIGWIWNRSIPTPGDNYTVNVGSYDMDTLQQHEGASYRQIVDLANFNRSLYIQTLGQSDDPFDKHHGDLMQLWRNGQYIPMSTDSKDWGKTEEMILKAG